MSQFELNQQQRDKKKEFDCFIRDYVTPFADRWDSEELLPGDVVSQLANANFLGATIPTEYGGQGYDPLTFGLLCESLGKGSISLISLLTVHGMVSHSIDKWGSSEQREYWLPKLANGSMRAAFALSEPNVGSDPKTVETTAKPKGKDKYVLNGRKKWISCGQIADLYLVIAQAPDGPTAFLVKRSIKNFSVTPMKGLYGFRSAMLAELVFDNFEVSESDIVGKAGLGFSYVASSALDYGRYCVGWGCVGLGQACLEASLEYSSKRKQFGQALRKHQLIQAMIADMATNHKAARALCIQAAYLKSQNEPDLIMETSIAKYFASKMAVKAANDAVQIHGANGCCDKLPVQRYLRDAKITEIIEGSSQIQQIIISQNAYQRHLFRSRFES